MSIPMIWPGNPNTRLTDPSNGTRGRKRFDPMTRYAIDQDGCWLWQGFVNDQGYGQCWAGSAHRHFYTKLVGAIPTGKHLDHVCHDPSICAGGPACKHRRCVNPEHLKVVTPRENVMRSNSFVVEHANATHCPYGHPYEGENLVILPAQRTCRACLHRRWLQSHAKNRSRIASVGDLTDSESRVLAAFSVARTDEEAAHVLGVVRQTVQTRRGALHRGGLVEQVGTKPIARGVRPALLWRAT